MNPFLKIEAEPSTVEVEEDKKTLKRV